MTILWSHPPAGNTRAVLVHFGEIPVQDVRALLAARWEWAAWPVPGQPPLYLFHKSWGGR